MGLSDMGAVCLALDYGLWSTSDIDAMLKARQPFIVELPPSNDSSEDILARYRGVLGAGETGDVVGDVRGIRIACVWSHGQMVPHVGDAAGEGYSGYAYLLFDPSRRADEKNSGYRILFSNEVMEPADVFAIYQGKHVVEKRFENMEGLLDLHEPSLSYERMLPGGLFVAFVALALAAWLQKRMREAGLDGEYTLRELLDEVETIERFTQEGRAARIGKLTSRQRALFTKLGYSLSDE